MKKYLDRFYFKITFLNLSLSIVLLLILIMILVYPVLVRNIGGAFKYAPELVYSQASPGARTMIDKALKGIGPGEYIDYHVHIIGIGKGNTGCYVNPGMQSWLHPLQYFKYNVYLSASGVKNYYRFDEEYVKRLARLIRAIKGHGKYHILAFDSYYNKDGSIDKSKSTFFVPNEYVYNLSVKYSDIFIPVVSVHPYKKNALKELESWAKKGISMVKWLPNSMGMDPSDPDLDSYYGIMKKYNMILLSHTGEEQAIESGEGQKLGNPLLLKRPLDLGVKVIMAHCASLGKCQDFRKAGHPEVQCIDLFIDMMKVKKYEGILFSDVSGLVHFNRIPASIFKVLKNTHLHNRLVNGSDYPLPAINAVIRTSRLAEYGLLTEEESKYLNEIYKYNPLLFDIVVKRTLRLKSDKDIEQVAGVNRKVYKFPVSLFKENPNLH